MSKVNRMKGVVKKINHHKYGLRTDIPSQMAAAGPPLGTQLGQLGVNIANFVKDFNLRTSVFREGVPIPTRTTVNPDRSYNLLMNHPNITYFLKQAAGVKRGGMGSEDTCGYLTHKHIYEIAKIKSEDLQWQMVDMQEICSHLIDRAHSIGIRVVDEIDPEWYNQFLKDREKVIENQKEELKAIKEAKLLRTA